VGELREAVDFLRYYADQGQGVTAAPRGVFACISPWNFPLAIFTGQIAAALAAGNAVLAKPAEQTPLIAALAVDLMHRAGVPAPALQLLPGDGATVGAALTSNPCVNGVAFTGSTETALLIRRAMARHLSPTAPLIAETGGLNAMLVDSTALPEQAVRDIIIASFQSAGQRCSALRCLYVQDDIAEPLQEMLFGAMEELALGDPWHLATDVGPVIDAEAQADIAAYIAAARAEGRVLKELAAPAQGHFIAPTVIRVAGIAQMPREIFGPVLHIATFKAAEIPRVIAAVNATGYGLTFGLHSRIDDRVQTIVEALRVGNTYVNRNQIGAVVGSQPFGGEGLSGTGPKAGGPDYLARFTVAPAAPTTADGPAAAEPAVQAALASASSSGMAPGGAALHVRDLPGPTGESNRLSAFARAPLLCLGPSAAAALTQAEAVRRLGGRAVEAPGLDPAALTRLSGFSGALCWATDAVTRPYAEALAARRGPDPAADRRPARRRPRHAGAPRLHRHHRLGRQRPASGRSRGKLTGAPIPPHPTRQAQVAPCATPPRPQSRPTDSKGPRLRLSGPNLRTRAGGNRRNLCEGRNQSGGAMAPPRAGAPLIRNPAREERRRARAFPNGQSGSSRCQCLHRASGPRGTRKRWPPTRTKTARR
jgi:RHH-type proline utilization regulon transcriptional repressor/proline dehydrogenase/delta 1-pyrroline-5-carboxylate dehydrogenase